MKLEIELTPQQLEQIRIAQNWVKGSSPVDPIDPVDPPPANDPGYIVWLPGSPTSVAMLEANAAMVRQSPIAVIASQCWQGDNSHMIMGAEGRKFNSANIKRDIKRIKAATGKKAAFVVTTMGVTADFRFLENDAHYQQMANGIVQSAEAMMTDGDSELFWDNEIYEWTGKPQTNHRWANFWGQQNVTPLKAYQRGFDVGRRLPRGLTLYYNHGIEKAYTPTDVQALHAGARGNNPQENRSLGHFVAGMINAGVQAGARIINCAQLYGLRGEEFTRFLNWEARSQAIEGNNMNPSGDGLDHWKYVPYTFMAYTNDWEPAVRIGRDMDPPTYQKLLSDINRQKNKGTATVIYGEWFSGDKTEMFNKFWNPTGDWQRAIKGA
jgi:hypothetical protein